MASSIAFWFGFLWEQVGTKTRHRLAFLLAGALTGLAAGTARAASPFRASSKGTTGAAFLKIGPGARAAAMGEAFCAAADDATALYWNPAGLARVPRRSASFTHASHLGSSFMDHIAYAQNHGPYGAWGLGTHLFAAGSFPVTDETGTETGKISPHDLALSAGYAYTLRDLEFLSDLNGFSLGISAKYIHSRILSTARTGAMDMGALSPPYAGGRLRLGAGITNVGGRLSYQRELEDLPLAIRLGAEGRLLPGLLLTLDGVAPSDNSPQAALGVESWWAAGTSARVAARAGFNSRSLGDITGFAGVSFGTGLTLRRLSFDYALVPYASVGMTHRISLGSSF